MRNQDNREHDLPDSDDDDRFEGGVAAAVRHLPGRQPAVRGFIAAHNPDALRDMAERDMAERFREAIDRGLWTPRRNATAETLTNMRGRRLRRPPIPRPPSDAIARPPSVDPSGRIGKPSCPQTRAS